MLGGAEAEAAGEDGGEAGLVALIRQHGGTARATDIMHWSRRWRGSAELAEDALDKLVRSRLARWEPEAQGAQGGRPTRRLVLDGETP